MSKFTKRRLKQRLQEQKEVYDAMRWEDIYQLPLHKNKYSDYIYSSNDTMSISSFKDEWSCNDEVINNIISIINGEKTSDLEPEWTAKGCDIYYKNEYAFCVRGWGHLTGCGALNLPSDVAERIQDDFINYILRKLNNIK